MPLFLGKMGGAKGRRTRAAKLTPEERSASARKAGVARSLTLILATILVVMAGNSETLACGLWFVPFEGSVKEEEQIAAVGAGHGGGIGGMY
jgi:hypothetical protein